MASNRRKNTTAIRFVPALWTVLLCTLIGGFAVGYVVQKNTIFELGQQAGARQQQLERLKKENQVLADRLANMQLPRRLAERVAELKLGLVPPQPSQILWVTEPALASPATNMGGVQFVRTGQ